MDVSSPCIKVQVHTKYIAEQSNPELQRYVFAYMITIKNLSTETVQLISRRWLITDANGKQMSVEGEGVVGKQPFIDGNDEYTYSSGTALETPVGVMQGQYIMHDSKGVEFSAEIDPFRLAVPNVLN
ncbi:MULTISPECIES: Co2+/Mg2+ efflux protein ApaG [Vibrio]|uniref:Protein ApaG n=1 Tax=Vibrio proteolyticus NBRC 13287 TaxID=1219065 RepID=U3BQU4_VIBPR|nr:MULTISPECIES: Co2+/Mg2+ efflux protein ApaG [Vibrio]NAW57870.1 Co2+/Mg2+ efflux protein ApaG [Vibrio sp. V36_P2S2PM302]NAX23605.1 Co2+/Mg2+ efflux protein ApaG [Vibrio sp. V39_P1S14PM300]NAX24186.1 Co2+/Mg2+ efflux protein ApaG [Vibrio sp. V38_P2S17PM301]NAX31615.1 Co2+/Mg2+ efflux protein ApaG [Vibrio sp. V37_P2S8PM304]GAD68878.1 protein ApaG [Vibrio proteolyticus NBRC 13287]